MERRTAPARSDDTRDQHAGLASAGPLPLVVGITGHRDLRSGDVPTLENVLRSVFRDLQTQCPSTPLVVLSSLAEGADRLGARVALELGARLIVPLPMDLPLYESDFETEVSRAEFHELLGRAERAIASPGSAEASRRAHTPAARAELYERAGAYVAANCQILIALWDGNETGLVGGTAEIVKFKLNGVDQRYARSADPLDPPDTGPVIRILTPRESATPPADAFSVQTLYPTFPGESKGGERTYEQRIFSRIETFNRDAVRVGPSIARDETRSAAQLSVLPDAAIPGGAASVRRTYAVSDALALRFQAETRRMLLSLFVWIFVAASLFESAKSLAEGFPPLVGIYAAIIVAAAVWYYIVNREDYRSKFLDYRALAEGLRVQFFWWLGRIHEDVASHYLRKQRGELDWIRVAVANANLLATIADPDAAHSHPSDESMESSLRTVLGEWVQSQYDYYIQAAVRDQRLSDKISAVASWFFAAAVAVAVVRGLLIVVHFGVFGSADAWLDSSAMRPRLIDLTMTILFIIAALLANYAEKRALSQQAKQFERMSAMFGACVRRLPRFINERRFQAARELIRELGREALNENADWVILHRERPLELSVKG